MSASPFATAVEFVGGPYDGHKQVIETASGDLPLAVRMPARFTDMVCTDDWSGRLALYVLDGTPYGWQYRHAGWSIAPGDLPGWLYALVRWSRRIANVAINAAHHNQFHLSRARLFIGKPLR
jgi:hypothetical protein